MPTRAWPEMWLALVGVLRLARGDRGGLACFDVSLDGFWRSFRAAVIGYPLYLVLLTMRVTIAEWQRSGGAVIVTVETIAYVIGWVAFPLVMLTVARLLGRGPRYLDFMVPYNWSQLPQSALFVLVGLATGVTAAAPAQAIEAVAAIAVLVYEWFIARVALEVTAAAAAVVVVIDLVLGVLVSNIASSLY